MRQKVANQSAIDDRNWQILFDEQFDNLQQDSRISRIWINGFSKMGLDNSVAPSLETINQISQKYTGWQFIENDEEFTDPIIWNEEIARREMSLSNFVRTPEELVYCDQPDRWHDIFGHVPLLMDAAYSQMYHNIAQLYLEAYQVGGDEKRLQIGNLNWFITEVGIIEEGGHLRAFGATLYSSSGELEKAFASQPQPATLENIINLPAYDRSKLQDNYFIIESLEQVNQMVATYREKYLNN